MAKHLGSSGTQKGACKIVSELMHFVYQEMRGDNIPKAHTMRKTANDESGISNLSSVDFAKNLAYSDLTVGLKICVSTSLETQRGYSLTDERD